MTLSLLISDKTKGTICACCGSSIPARYWTDSKDNQVHFNRCDICGSSEPMATLFEVKEMDIEVNTMRGHVRALEVRDAICYFERVVTERL